MGGCHQLVQEGTVRPLHIISKHVALSSGRAYWHHYSDELGVSGWVAMMTGRRGKHLYSSSNEDGGGHNDGEIPKERQSMMFSCLMCPLIF